jgi:hypothetical protein
MDGMATETILLPTLKIDGRELCIYELPFIFEGSADSRPSLP